MLTSLPVHTCDTLVDCSSDRMEMMSLLDYVKKHDSLIEGNGVECVKMSTTSDFITDLVLGMHN